MRLRVTLLCLLGCIASARADRDVEVALSGVIQQAHDHLDAQWLRRMMAPSEQRRFEEEGGAAQFRRLRQSLGVAQLVACAEGVPEPEERLPSAAGDRLPAQPYRCEVTCQHGAYAVLLTLSPPDPLVRPAPRPGRVERLVLGSPLFDAAPWGWAGPGEAGAYLGAIWLAALLAISFGALRLTGRAPFSRRGSPRAAERTPQRGAQRTVPLTRAAHEVVLVLRLLGALLLLLLGAPLLLRLGPRPLWGDGAITLALLGLVALSVGLLLCALGGYLRPRGGLQLGLGLGTAILLLPLPCALALRTNLLDFPQLAGEAAPPRQQGRYRLPLGLSRGDPPAYVRHGGPLLDLVLLHEGGRSCKGRAPQSCRAFGVPVLAPADGVVRLAVDRYPDQPIGARDREHPMGNYILISHGGGDEDGAGERSLLTHLRSGSLRVRAGQRVRAGEAIASVGSSGDSDEPHLAMELVVGQRALPGRRPPPFCGASFDPERSTGVPILLDGYVRVGLLGRRLVEHGAPACGDRLAPPG